MGLNGLQGPDPVGFPCFEGTSSTRHFFHRLNCEVVWPVVGLVEVPVESGGSPAGSLLKVSLESP